jgi:hypothetical protein
LSVGLVMLKPMLSVPEPERTMLGKSGFVPATPI